MYVAEEIDKRIYFRCSDGTITIYSNYDEFIKIENNNLHYYKDRLVTDFKHWKHHGWREKFHLFSIEEILIVDVYMLTSPSGGFIYNPEKIWDDLCDYRRKPRRKYWGYDHPYEFRKDPVPGTGGNRWHFGCYYRYPKTTQEKRMSCYHGQLARGRRRKPNLPDCWDDVVRSDHKIKHSWKKQKKRKQWM